MRPEHWIYTLPLRIRSLFRRQQVDQDLEEEIRDHLERKTADYIARGLSPEEARYAARREFGGIEQAKENCRDMRKVNWLYDLAQDATYTLRQLRKSPGFAAFAILTLALGIGANTAMFTVVDSLLVRPVPFRNANRLVSIWAMGGQYEGVVSWLTYQDIRTRCHSLEDLMRIGGDTSVMETPQGGQRVGRLTVTPNFLDTLGVHPIVGRPFNSRDYKYGAAAVVLLSWELWRGPFSADPNILERVVRIGGVPFTVVGIMPEDFHFHPYDGEVESRVWLPMQLSPSRLNDRHDQLMRLVGRLKTGATCEAVRADLAAIVRSGGYPRDFRYLVQPYLDALTASARLALLALTGAVLLVLLIACVNVANLQLARHLARRQELAVRAALGAGRGRLLRQLTAEGALLATAGALAGLAIAAALLVAVNRLPPNFVPRADEIKLRASVFAMLALFAAVTTMLSSFIPALLATRTPPEEALRESSAGSTPGRKRSRLSEWMVAGEVAISAILLVSTGLMFHTLYNLEHIHFGFDLDRVTTFIAMPGNSRGTLGELSAQESAAAAPTESIVTRVYQPIVNRLRLLPGVIDVGLSAWAPFDHNTMGVYFLVPKHPEIRSPGILSQLCIVSSGYARAIGTPVVAGRVIADGDTAGSTPVAVVNEAFAKRAFPGENPVGEQISDPARHYTIVGVLSDARQHDLTRTPDPEVLLAYQQFPTTGLMYTLLVASGTNFIVRTRGAVDVADGIRRVFRQSAPDFALDHLRTMRGALDEVTFDQRLGLYLTGSFAAVAILMVLTGLYGVLAQLVGQRRREIGIRMALGASRGSIQAMILRRASWLSTLGLLVGLLASIEAGRLLRVFLFGVRPVDGSTYFAVTVVVLVVGTAAAFFPARSAAKTDFRTALQ
jgi:predicted permease